MKFVGSTKHAQTVVHMMYILTERAFARLREIKCCDVFSCYDVSLGVHDTTLV